jgi:hypothetical protein
LVAYGIAILKWPGFNEALITALVVTIGLTLLVIPIGKRRPVGKPLSWGEAVAAATFVFLVMFMAYGVVPHQWLTHAQNEKRWRADHIYIGHSFGAEHRWSWLPLDITLAALGDVVATLIYGGFLGLHIYMFSWWQKRGRVKPAELPTSTFGRPLVRRG